MLEGFEGFLHCDGFGGYDAYASDHGVKLIGCWMHCRRNFFKVARNTKSKGLAYTAVQIIKALYDIEAEMRAQGLFVQQRYDYRQQYSKPLLEQFKIFLDENRPKVLSKSPLGEAFTYAVNQWPKLIRYIEDGRLEIDNGLSERKIKPFVIGRNYAEFNIMQRYHWPDIKQWPMIPAFKLFLITIISLLKQLLSIIIMHQESPIAFHLV